MANCRGAPRLGAEDRFCACGNFSGTDVVCKKRDRKRPAGDSERKMAVPV
jgi:hypothetical protein